MYLDRFRGRNDSCNSEIHAVGVRLQCSYSISMCHIGQIEPVHLQNLQNKNESRRRSIELTLRAWKKCDHSSSRVSYCCVRKMEVCTCLVMLNNCDAWFNFSSSFLARPRTPSPSHLITKLQATINCSNRVLHNFRNVDAKVSFLQRWMWIEPGCRRQRGEREKPQKNRTNEKPIALY